MMDKGVKGAVNSSKVFNLFRTINYIYSHDEVTVARITDETGIPLPTAYRSIRFLLKSGLLVQTHEMDSKSGRKASLYSINKQSIFIMGIFLDKTILSVFIMDLNGTIYEKCDYPLEREYSRPEILDLIDKGIEQTVTNMFGDPSQISKIEAIGFTAAAALDIKEGKIIVFSNMKDMAGFKVVEYMEQKYNLHTILIKLTPLEVLSYLNEFKKSNIDTYIFVHISVGIGAGIIIDGKLYGGSFGNAGELTRILTEVNGKEVNMELAYSARHIYKKIHDYVAQNPESRLAEIFAELEAANPINRDKMMMKCLDIALKEEYQPFIDNIMEAIDGWAKLVCGLLAYFDPQACIIGGDISDDTPAVFDLVRQKVLQRLDTPALIIPAISGNTLEKAVLLNILDEVFNNIFVKLVGEQNYSDLL